MRPITVFVLFLFLVFSCSKDEIRLPDNIKYFDLVPDTIITSIDSVVYIGEDDFGGIYELFSLTSTGIYEFDINNDGENDFKITHTFFTCDVDNPSPHHWGDEYRNFKISISGLNGNQIDISDNSDDQVWFDEYLISDLDSTTLISDKSHWTEMGYTYYSIRCIHIARVSYSNYIGIKFILNGKEYYGWIGIKLINRDLSDIKNPLYPTEAIRPDPTIKEIVVMNWALNLTESNEIIPGQKE